MRDRHGQGSTEYLILLSIILVIALVVVGLIGQFFQQAGGLSDSQYRSYWMSAQPFSVSDSIQYGSANITLVIQNVAAHELVLNNITLTLSGEGTTYANRSNIIFMAGQKRTVVILNNPTLPNCANRSGRSYLYEVVLNYDDEQIAKKIQTGNVPLAVNCQ